MDGESPTGSRKVGLLSKNQLWAYLVDPFRSKLKKQVQLLPSPPTVMGDMIKFYSNNTYAEEDHLKCATNLYMNRGSESGSIHFILTAHIHLLFINIYILIHILRLRPCIASSNLDDL